MHVLKQCKIGAQPKKIIFLGCYVPQSQLKPLMMHGFSGFMGDFSSFALVSQDGSYALICLCIFLDEMYLR